MRAVTSPGPLTASAVANDPPISTARSSAREGSPVPRRVNGSPPAVSPQEGSTEVMEGGSM